ncbi:hypothetical protein J437_LFUL005336, partial [Ladona fulva]
MELNGHTLQVRFARSGTKLKKVPTIRRFERKKKVNAGSTEIISADGSAPGKRRIGINDLNSSCLLHIFSYFTMREKRRLEFVCKIWRRILLEEWIARSNNEYKASFRWRRNEDEFFLGRRRKVNPNSTTLIPVHGSGHEENGCTTGKRNFGIDHLNDDCFVEIFSYFSMREKIRLELVCRRWRRILLDQWKMTTHLNFEKEHRFAKLNVNILQGILEKCGPSIQTVDLPQFHILRRSTVHMIANFCINLRHLSIQNLALSSKDVEVLISNCKLLKSLELKRPLTKKHHNFGFIQQVLEKIPLESFVFMHKKDDCKFLSSLPPTLKHLELISCSKLNETYLISGLAKATNLQSFRISKVPDTLFCAENFYSNISNVEEFCAVNITDSHSRFFGGSARPLHLYNHLHNLRKLYLKCSQFPDDSILAKISEGCKKLEVLDISGCELHTHTKQVSDRGIAALVKNCALTDFSISHCPGFTDHGLSLLANTGKLKKLSCAYCERITDFGCSQLISLCLDLELLNIENCRNISAVVVASAMSTVSLRTEKKTLHLFVKGTGVRQSEIPDSNKSLEVHRKGYIKNCSVPKPKIKPRRVFYRR